MKTRTGYSAKSEDSAEIVLPADLGRAPSQALLSIIDSFGKKVETFSKTDNLFDVRLIEETPTYKRVHTALVDFKVFFGENPAGNVHAVVYVSGNRKSRDALFESGEGVVESTEERFGAYLTDLVQTDLVFTEGPLKRMGYRIADARLRIPLSEANGSPRPHIELIFPKGGIYNGNEGKDPSAIGTDIYLLTISPMFAWFVPNLKNQIRAMLKQ